MSPQHAAVAAHAPAPAADAGRPGQVRTILRRRATAYLRDVLEAEVHIVDAGHFALEEAVDDNGVLIRRFLARQHLA